MSIRVDIRSYNNDGEEFTYEINEHANAYLVGEHGNLNLFILNEGDSKPGRLIQTYATNNWFSVRVLLEGDEE